MSEVRFNGEVRNASYIIDTASRIGKSQPTASVYAGRSDTNSHLAIKAISEDGLADDSRKAGEQAKREIVSGQRLNNADGILRCIDYGFVEIQGSIHLALVYPAASEGLDERINQPGAELAYQVLSDLLPALSALAAANVVHRDISPDNIMFHEGNWKLIDFGLARFMDEATASKTLRGWGKQHYRPPESDESPVAAYDMWQLGKVVLACVSGKADSDVADVADSVLRVLLGGMLETDPSQRITPEQATAQIERVSPANPMAEVWRQRASNASSARQSATTALREEEDLAALMNRRRDLVMVLFEMLRGALDEFDADPSIDEQDAELVVTWSAGDFTARLHARIQTDPGRTLPFDAIADLCISSGTIEPAETSAQLMASLEGPGWLRVRPDCPCSSCFLRWRGAPDRYLDVVNERTPEQFAKRWPVDPFEVDQVAALVLPLMNGEPALSVEEATATMDQIWERAQRAGSDIERRAVVAELLQGVSAIAKRSQPLRAGLMLQMPFEIAGYFLARYSLELDGGDAALALVKDLEPFEYRFHALKQLWHLAKEDPELAKAVASEGASAIRAESDLAPLGLTMGCQDEDLAKISLWMWELWGGDGAAKADFLKTIDGGYVCELLWTMSHNATVGEREVRTFYGGMRPVPEDPCASVRNELVEAIDSLYPGIQPAERLPWADAGDDACRALAEEYLLIAAQGSAE